MIIGQTFDIYRTTKMTLGNRGLTIAERPIEYLVPAGTFTLESLIISTFDTGDSIRATLYWDNTVIPQTPIYTKGRTYRIAFDNVQFTSDGTNKLIIDLHVFGKVSRKLVHVSWTGNLS
jgi:hypothetical protein